MSETAVAVAPTQQTSNFQTSHEVCCIDEEALNGRISMCGVPIPDDEILEEDDPDCLVCLDLIEQWAHNVDTYGEDPHLPGDEPCRLCPRKHWNQMLGGC